MRSTMYLFFAFAALVSSKPQFLATFKVGDQDLSSQKENGLYSVTYDQLLAALKPLGLEGELSGIPVADLALLTSPVDTLATWALGNPKNPFGDQSLFAVGLDVRDHSASGKGGANATFDSGDTLFFYGQGTSRFAQVPQTDPQSKIQPYFFQSSPYSYTRSYVLAIDRNRTLRARGVSYGSVSSQSLGLHLRRFEKDSLLRDMFYRNWFAESGYEDLETGREFFWLWDENKKGRRVWSGLERGHVLAGDLGSEVASSAWMSASFYPDRARYTGSGPNYGSKNANRLPWVQRFKNIRPTVLVNGQSWVPILGDTAVLGGGGFLAKIEGLKSTGNSFAIQMDSVPGEMRFDGLTLAWKAPYVYQGQKALPIVNDVNAEGLVGFSVQGGSSGQVLRLDRGEWLGIVPTWNSTSFVDSVSWDRSWVVAKDSNMTPQIEAYLRPRQVIHQLDLGVNGNGQLEQPLNITLCPEQFISECLEYKKYREEGAAVSVPTSVVVLEDVFMHYNAGQPTPESVRDFLRFARSSWAPKLRSATLIGDGHVDPRNITGKWDKSIFPVYSENDLSSDDFYAILDSNRSLSGKGPNSGVFELNIQIGRLPFSDKVQFTEYLQKIRNFEKTGRGVWGQKVTLLADDFRQGSLYDGIPHVSSSERISTVIADSAPWIQQQKIYLADYEPDASWKKFAANRDLVRALSEGRYFVNYFGHGAASVLSDEGLFDASSIKALGLNQRNSILTAFSCLVGRFDALRELSLVELFLRKSPNGGIATIAALRESEAGKNEDLAWTFYRELFSGKNQTLGQVLTTAKNSIPTSAKTNAAYYALMGDPELRLLPLAGQPVFESLPDTIQALMPITIKGKTPGIANGKISLLVQEQARLKRWVEYGVPMGDGGSQDSVSALAKLEGKNIYSEIIPIKNGQFEASFISPRKISFGDSNARILSFAWSDDIHNVLVSNRQGVVLDGTSAYADSLRDSTPPTIQAYPCRSVGRVPFGKEFKLNLPACVEIEVQDEIGLDFSNGVDEGITYEWVGVKAVDHPEFLEQTGRKAVFRATLDNATTGQRQLRIVALDVLGNRSLREWTIDLLNEQPGLLADVYSQPNPMRSSTRFHFKVAGQENSFFNIRIFDQTGKLVKILRNVIPGETIWDGRDESGNLLGNGLYFYRVFSVTPYVDARLGTTKEKIFTALQRLVISR